MSDPFQAHLKKRKNELSKNLNNSDLGNILTYNLSSLNTKSRFQKIILNENSLKQKVLNKLTHDQILETIGRDRMLDIIVKNKTMFQKASSKATIKNTEIQAAKAAKENASRNNGKTNKRLCSDPAADPTNCYDYGQ